MNHLTARQLNVLVTLKDLHGIVLSVTRSFLVFHTFRSFFFTLNFNFWRLRYPTMADDKPNCKVILANNIAKSLLEEVRDGLSKIERKPLLVGFLSSPDPAARVYAEWTGKTCTEK